jgi:hypothetical protein
MMASPGGVLLPELSDRVDELDRQLRELRDTPQDTIGTTNTIRINAKGEAETPSSGGGEGLNPFVDKFATEESLANYGYEATEGEPGPSLSFGFGPAGMTVLPLAAGIEFLFLLQEYRGAQGGRCLDCISILHYHIAGEAVQRKVGNISHVRTQTTGPHKTGAYNAWTSVVEGLAGSGGVNVENRTRKWVAAGAQQSSSGGAHAIEPKFGFNSDVWIVTGVFGTAVVTQIYAFDPMKATIEQKPQQTGEMGTPITEAYGNQPGLNWATPGDVGFLMRAGAGDIIKEWAVYPLSWR